MGRMCCGLKATEFRLAAPTAKKVSIAGSFNNWGTNDLPAKKDSKGDWSIKVDLKPGKYEYKFFVDGSWINDRQCTTCVPNAFGTQNCVIEVRG